MTWPVFACWAWANCHESRCIVACCFFSTTRNVLHKKRTTTPLSPFQGTYGSLTRTEAVCRARCSASQTAGIWVFAWTSPIESLGAESSSAGAASAKIATTTAAVVALTKSSADRTHAPFPTTSICPTSQRLWNRRTKRKRTGRFEADQNYFRNGMVSESWWQLTVAQF